MRVGLWGTGNKAFSCYSLPGAKALLVSLARSCRKNEGPSSASQQIDSSGSQWKPLKGLLVLGPSTRR